MARTSLMQPRSSWRVLP
uniref:Uncharacterized protein n=1 Tax=Arundo donax TaxID=35708 RepID=A0A0A9FLL9_ARUDO